MTLWKCCTQYSSKFGKLSSSHRTGKNQFLFQSQRKTMPKNVQTTTQLHSSHKLAKSCSIFSKSGFSSMWAINFHMLKLDLEKAEEPEIKFPMSVGSSKKQEGSRKTSTSALLTIQSLWLDKSQQTVENSSRDGKRPDHISCLLRNMYTGQEATVKTGHGTIDWFQIEKGVHQCCILSPYLFNLHAEYIMQNARLDEA